MVAGSWPSAAAAVAAAALAAGLPLTAKGTTSEFSAGAAESPGGVVSSFPSAAGVAARVTGSESASESTHGVAEAGAACLSDSAAAASSWRVAGAFKITGEGLPALPLCGLRRVEWLR